VASLISHYWGLGLVRVQTLLDRQVTGDEMSKREGEVPRFRGIALSLKEKSAGLLTLVRKHAKTG